MGDSEKLRDAAKDDGRSDSKSAAAAALTVGDSQAVAAPRTPRRASRAVAWCAAAVSVLLIGASAWAIASSGYFDPVDDGVALSAASESESAFDSDGDVVESESPSDSVDDGEKEEDGSAEEDSASSADGDEDDGEARSATSEDADRNSNPGSVSGSGSGSGSNSGLTTGGSAGSSTGSEGSSGSAGAAESDSGNRESLVTVTVTVDSSNVGSPVSCSQKLSFSEDSRATVYDALVGTGLAVSSSYSSGFGSVYVSSIGGLAEKAEGYPGSGWKYFVDGSEPDRGCNQYELYDGASIVWKYVLSADEGL